MYSPKKRNQFIVDRWRVQNAARERGLSNKDYHFIERAIKVYRLKKRRVDNSNISAIDFIAIKCINENNHKVLSCCFHVGIDPNKVIDDNMNETLLHKAVQARNTDHEIVKLLLKHKANVDCENTYKQTPIFFVIREVNKMSIGARITLFKLLIKNGANINHQDNFLNTPLATFITCISSSKITINQMTTIIQICLEAGAKATLNHQNVFGKTILHLACQSLPHLYDDSHIHEYKNLFQLFIRNGAKPNICDSVRQTPLHTLLTDSKNICLLNVFKQSGARFNQKNKLLQTPLYSYCVTLSKQGDLDNPYIDKLLHGLIRNGCKLNSTAIDKTTALHMAAANLNAHICRILIESNADIHARDYLNRTPLHFAAKNRLAEVTEVCIKCGSDINSRDIFGYTPLHYAVMYEHTNVVKLLCDNQANINARSKLGVMPIHLTGECGNVKMINVFVDRNANLNGRDQWNATPLIYASSIGNLKTIRALLKAGADRTLRDQDEKNPFDHSLINGQREAAKLLGDNEDEIVRFSRHIFPNHELMQPTNNEMKNYYCTLTHELKRTFQTTTNDELVESILSTPGIGRVNNSSEESKEIFLAVEKYASAILKRVAQLDSRFDAFIYPAGSVVEDVKVGYPDEFDFMCILTEYQHLIECLEYINETPGFTRAKLFDKCLSDIDDELKVDNRYLNSSNILHYFRKLVLRASYSIDMNKIHPQLSVGADLPYEPLIIFDNALIAPDLLALEVTWCGKVYKRLHISIDLTPAIFMHEYPPNARNYSHIVNTTMWFHGIYIIPKESKRAIETFTSFSVKKLKQSATVWRLSFSHIEKKLITTINEIFKDGYRLAKSFRLSPFSARLSVLKLGNVNGQQQLYSTSKQTLNVNTNKDLINVRPQIYDDVEFDGLNAIHSYHLKNLFLNYMEECYFEKTSHTCQELAITLYDKLIKCDQQGFLPSYFIPSQNLYYHTHYSHSKCRIKNATMVYSEYILKTMRKLKFSRFDCFNKRIQNF